MVIYSVSQVNIRDLNLCIGSTCILCLLVLL